MNRRDNVVESRGGASAVAWENEENDFQIGLHLGARVPLNFLPLQAMTPDSLETIVFQCRILLTTISSIMIFSRK